MSRRNETDPYRAPTRRDDLEFNELNLKIKISYKTLLLVFVLFDVFHRVANVVMEWLNL